MYLGLGGLPVSGNSPQASDNDFASLWLRLQRACLAIVVTGFAIRFSFYTKRRSISSGNDITSWLR